MGGRGHEISMGANLGVYRLSLIRTGCNHQCTYWRGRGGSPVCLLSALGRNTLLAEEKMICSGITKIPPPS